MGSNAIPILVRHLGRDRLGITVGGFEMISDQPVGEGGDGTGPSPTELFLAGLAGCVAFYAGRFLQRHGLPTEGLVVACRHGWAENPHRVGEIELTVEAPGLPTQLREPFYKVIEHCTVHNTLKQPPAVQITVHAKVGAVA